MRRPIIALAAAAGFVASACQGAAPATTDPYAVLTRAVDNPWHQVQVNVGATITSGAGSFSLDPSAIRIVVDSDAGKSLVHVSLPTALLNLDSTTAARLGITGPSLDADMVYDGAGLYAKSPVFKAVLTALLSSSGDLPAGDLGGWLRLATREDLDALAEGGAAPSPRASLDAATMRTALDSAGVALTIGGTAANQPPNADHLTGTVDVDKLLDSPLFDSQSRQQINTLRAALKGGSVGFDIWTDRGSGRFVEIDSHVSAVTGGGGSANVTVAFAAPASGTTFDAPSTYVDVPARAVLGDLLKLAGSSLNP